MESRIRSTTTTSSFTSTGGGTSNQAAPEEFHTPTSGNIDMTSMTADEAQLTILAALAAGFTEIKLTGELSKTGIGGNWGTFINNKKSRNATSPE